jgi:hypothetical protein
MKKSVFSDVWSAQNLTPQNLKAFGSITELYFALVFLLCV